ncbi:MAG: hypothetical protein R3F15_13205 [Lysobacterales bacterium]
MFDPFAGGKRLAQRTLRVQVLATLLTASVAAVWTQSLLAGLAAIWGGMAVVLGQALFAWRQFAGMAPAAAMLRRFFGAAALKWLVLFAVFGTGLIGLGLPAAGLLVGLIAAQLAGMWALLRYG